MLTEHIEVFFHHWRTQHNLFFVYSFSISPCIPDPTGNMHMLCFAYADVPCAKWTSSILQGLSLLISLKAQISQRRSLYKFILLGELFLAVFSDGSNPGTRKLTDSQPNLCLNINSHVTLFMTTPPGKLKRNVTLISILQM